MIGDWMAADVSKVSPRLISSFSSVRASEKPDSSSPFLPLCEGIPVASDRSVVSSVQYLLAESDGRVARCWITLVDGTTRVYAHTHKHTQIHTHTVFVQMKEVVDGCDA